MPPRQSHETYLLAILLVAKTHTGGPRIVFHYPHTPSGSSSALFSHNSLAATGSYGGTSSTDDSDESSESSWNDGDSTSDPNGADQGDHGSRSGRGSTVGKSSGMKGPGAWAREMEDDEDEVGGVNTASYDLSREAMGNSAKAAGKSADAKQEHEAEWERILSFKTESLEKLLSPQSEFHKRKFEVGLDGCFFVGAPMFVRDDGFWKKRRKRGEKKHKKRQESMVISYADDSQDGEDNAEDDEIDEGIDMKEPPAPKIVLPPGFEPGYGHSMSSATSEAGSDTKETATAQKSMDMTMFNVVFIMNPPALEYQVKVREMYDNVIRKYARALKVEQARSNYVWNESRRILAMKSKAKEDRLAIRTLWNNIISSSTLARSIKVIYDAISKSDIAHIHLSVDFETSFQIPRAPSTPYVPTATEPQIPGLWLTTANVVDEDDAELPIAQHCALLLLADTETLIKEIEGDSRDHSTPLAFYLRNIIPTKSLHKLSIMHSISPTDMEMIARHLVYWRRARLIPPLHPRDTYIVSPNADLSALHAAIPAYAARFPTLPSLPQMLSKLSLAPKPYASLIPTNDHRPMYMEILAWLMRGGWVTQLRTFAWVRVDPSIKAEVQTLIETEAREAEEAEIEAAAHAEEASKRNSSLQDLRGLLSSAISRRSNTNVRAALDETIAGSRPGTSHRSPIRPSSTSTDSSEHSKNLHPRNGLTSPTSPRHGPIKRPSPLHLHREASRPTSPITAKNSPNSPHHPLSPTPSFTPLPPSPTLHSSAAHAAHSSTSSRPSPPSKTHTPSIILSPTRATELEARWLDSIRARLPDKDAKELWPVLLRYLDGRRALEDVSVREGLKRKRIAAALGRVREGGWLVEVRHW